MIHRYPGAQIVFGFSCLVATILIFSTVAVEIMLGAFGWSHLIVGSSLHLMLLDIPLMAAVAGCLWALRDFYSRKRPIVIDQTTIASLDFWGRAKAKIRWDDVTKINRQLLFDPFSYKNAWCYDVSGSDGLTIRFDDTIDEYQSLVAGLNCQMAAHNIAANSIMRGPDVLQGVIDPVERRRLVKFGRPSRVTSFDEQLGADQG